MIQGFPPLPPFSHPPPPGASLLCSALPCCLRSSYEIFLCWRSFRNRALCGYHLQGGRRRQRLDDVHVEASPGAAGRDL